MKTKFYLGLTVAGAALLGSSLYFNVESEVVGAIRPTQNSPAAELSADRYTQHVSFLASPDMKGRGNGTPELERAAEYIESQFKLLGLQPGGEAGTYYQRFEITTGTEFGPGNSLQLNGSSLRAGTDFVTIPFSSKGDFEGPVVFAGYGITAPDLKWDDYSNLDATGKVVVVFRHEPEELDANSRFNGRNFTEHATFMNKAVNAKFHGAKAIIFVTDPNNHTGEPDTVGPATRGAETTDAGIPAIHATRDSLSPLFTKIGRNLADVQKEIDSKMAPQSFVVSEARLRIVADVTRVKKTLRNVIAAVPGSDPKLRQEWVVVGAHYDHLGLGAEQSSLDRARIGEIHHGADDNASGTAGVLELARFAANNRPKFKRSLLFMTFAGEELGLFGSNHFVNQPTVPLQGIVGMINMDMIGRVANNRINVIGLGSSPDFKPWVEEANKMVGLSLGFSDSLGGGGSDHMSFASKRIPIAFFFSGIHGDYHKPTDTAEKINVKGGIQVITLAAELAQRMANVESRPQYVETREERPVQNAGNSSGGGYGTYFGSVPDFRDDLDGVLFADVRAESPAGKAGLKGGDLLVEFDGRAIKNLNDFTYALQSKKPGDVVAVVVQREGKTLKVNVTLDVRR